MLTMAMTAATPMMMPSIVRAARSRLRAILRKAVAMVRWRKAYMTREG